MGRGAFPKELQNEKIELNNQKWIQEYRLATEHGTGYLQQLENFFRYKEFSSKPFNSFVYDDVAEYIEVMKDNDFTAYRIDTLISNIASFKRYLTEKHPENFSPNLLSNLHNLKIGQYEKKYAESHPLSYTQLELAKEFIKNNIRTEYIFQIFFQLGIDKKDFDICSPDNAVMEERAFINRDKRIVFNDVIEELLIRLKTEQGFKATTNMILDHLRKIEIHLKDNAALETDRTIAYNDVIKTHERFFFKCPSCEQKHENTSTNWVLVKIQTSNNLYLVCSHCKGSAE